MKKSILLGLLCIGAIGSNLSATTLIVGMGEDFSRVTFETPNLGVREYDVFYTFNELVPLGTADLLRIIDTEDDMILIDIANFPLANGDPNEFPQTVTFNGGIETNGPVGSDFFFFEHFVAGGQAGVDFSTGVAIPDPQSVAQGTFQSGPGSSAPFRIIEPGSTDVFVYGPGGLQPTVSPIPEPSSSYLLLLGGIGLCRRSRSRS